MTITWLDHVADPTHRFELYAGRAELAREAIGPRCADRHLLWLLLSGSYEGEIDGASMRLRAGDLVWIAPGSQHRLVAAGPVRKHFLRLTMALERPAGPAVRRVGAEAETWCDAIHAEQARGCDADPRRIRALLVLLLSAWQRAGETIAGGLTPERRSRLMHLVATDPARRWSRTELGKALGVSGLHLTRLVRRTFRMPLRRWLVDTRIRAAARELAASDATVTAIAHRYGYSDVFLFSRQFRCIMGRSPRTWRNMS